MYKLALESRNNEKKVLDSFKLLSSPLQWMFISRKVIKNEILWYHTIRRISSSKYLKLTKLIWNMIKYEIWCEKILEK